MQVCPTMLYFKINTIYNVYMYMVLMAFLPFIMLSILNALIVAKVRLINQSIGWTDRSINRLIDIYD